MNGVLIRTLDGRYRVNIARNVVGTFSTKEEALLILEQMLGYMNYQTTGKVMDEYEQELQFAITYAN